MASALELSPTRSSREIADRPSLASLEATARLIYQSMPPTPQYRWPLLDQRLGASVWVKHENHTPTGAFKVRGGLVYLDDLCRSKATRPSGVISATRGNHGQSVGFAARHYGVPAAVVVLFGNSVEKNAAMRALGVEVIERGHDDGSLDEQCKLIGECGGLLDSRVLGQSQ